MFCFVTFSYEQTLTEFEMSWMERRVILFFPKSSDGGGGFFFDILILGSTIIGVRTQQVLQKLDKVE